jgi:hypothetical protein
MTACSLMMAYVIDITQSGFKDEMTFVKLTGGLVLSVCIVSADFYFKLL